MKVETRRIEKTFDPFQVVITIESREEANAIRRALEVYAKNGTYDGYIDVVKKLLPVFTLL